MRMNWMIFVIVLTCLGSMSQGARECEDDVNCLFNKCCTSDKTCSDNDGSSQFGGEHCTDNCECKSGHCDFFLINECTCQDDIHCDNGKCCMENESCSDEDAASLSEGEHCEDDCECKSNDCDRTLINECTCAVDGDCQNPSKCCMDDNWCSDHDAGSLVGGDHCNDDCECESGECDTFLVNECTATPAPTPAPAPAPAPAPSPAPAPAQAPVLPPTSMNRDPILHGIHGQTIKWVGAEGGWYSLFVDKESGFQINVRPTGPLPEDFPERQYLTGIAVLSGGHSLVVEVKDPYSITTSGCPNAVSPCLTDGALRIAVDGKEANDLLAVTTDERVADGIYMSAANLPAECREFGGTQAWARMYREMLEGQRELLNQAFEDWVVASLHNAAASAWCATYVSEQGLAHVQSKQTVFRIVTPDVVIRFGVGVNHRRGGKEDRHGHELPELDFWQGVIELDGVSLDPKHLSGMLGETARPVIDDDGHEVMEGLEALRGTIEDYRVSSAEGTDFALLHIHNP